MRHGTWARHGRARHWISVSLAGASSMALASGDTALTEEDFFAPFPEVLTATRLAQPIANAPVAMTVIDRDMIEASSAINVAELLRLVPGFQVTYAEGIEAISTYHGYADSYPRRMQVLVDGRSVYSPSFNAITWSALPLTLDQVERIEVARGANAAAYGSNAVLGTINIITRSPETGDSLKVRMLGGGGDTFEGEVSHAAQFDDFSYSINAAALKSGGFPTKADDSDSRLLSAKAIYRATERDSLFFSAGARDTEFDSESFRLPRPRNHESDYQQVRWTRQLSGGDDFSLQFYHNRLDSPDRITYIDADLGIPISIDYSLFTHRYDTEFQHNITPADAWRISWGAGYRHDSVQGDGLLNQPDDITRETWRLFANAEWQVRPDTVINLGAMAEDFSDIGDYFSPRASVNWNLAENQTLRISVARAYRVPTAVERYGEGKLSTPLGDFVQLLGTPNNAPEEVDTVELGYLVEVPSIRGTFDARVFHTRVERLIAGAGDLSALPDQNALLTVRRLFNAGDLETTGLELQADFQPTRDSRVRLAYAYVEGDGERINRILADGSSNPLGPYLNERAVPNHTLTALVSQKLANDWTISGTFHYLSEMEWQGDGNYVDGQSRLDAKISKRFREAAGDMDVSLTVQNLLDTTYWEFSTPDPGGRFNGNPSEFRAYLQVRFSMR